RTGSCERGRSRRANKDKKYLNRVMLPFVPNNSEHHYWSEFGYRFFSRALQEFIGLDWRAMEVPVQASKYRKNYGHNLAIDKIVDGKFADLEMRDCLNVRILRAMGKGDMNYNNRSVFGILGYLFEIKMLIMWKDGVYIYEEYGSLNIASNPAQMSEMKSDDYQNQMENNVETEYNAESVQILKRKLFQQGHHLQKSRRNREFFRMF
ncbi:3704_t:CDS:2, partial [Funneliformis caledonium]